MYNLSPQLPHSATLAGAAGGSGPPQPMHSHHPGHNHAHSNSLPMMPAPSMPHPHAGFHPYATHYLPPGGQGATGPPGAFFPAPGMHGHLPHPGQLPTIGDDSPPGGSRASAAALAGAASAGVSASGVKKKTTRRYNASCDACRARKRKCPGRDPVTGVSLCTACGDRGVPCTYGNLGEPSRLRRADNENEKLKTAIREALEAGDLGEKDRILQSFLKHGPEVKSEAGLDSGTEAAAGTPAGQGRKKRGPVPGSGGARGAGAGKKQRTIDGDMFIEEHSLPGSAGHPYFPDDNGDRRGRGYGGHYYPEGADERHHHGYSPGLEQQQRHQQHGEYPGPPLYHPQQHPRDLDRLIAGQPGPGGEQQHDRESPRPVSSEGGASGSAPAQFTSNTIANTKPPEEEEDMYGIVASYHRMGQLALAARELGTSPEELEAEGVDDYTLQMAGCPSPEEEETLLKYYFCWLNPRYSLLDEGLFRDGRERKDPTFAAPLLLWAVFAHVAVHCPGFQDKRRECRVRNSHLCGCCLSVD